jgi:hypothetical protein
MGEPKSTASVNFEQFSEFSKGNRVFGTGHNLKNRQAAVEALNEWDLRAFRGCHKLEFSRGA